MKGSDKARRQQIDPNYSYQFFQSTRILDTTKNESLDMALQGYSVVLYIYWAHSQHKRDS